jgi:hypothetical protein
MYFMYKAFSCAEGKSHFFVLFFRRYNKYCMGNVLVAALAGGSERSIKDSKTLLKTLLQVFGSEIDASRIIEVTIEQADNGIYNWKFY